MTRLMKIVLGLAVFVFAAQVIVPAANAQEASGKVAKGKASGKTSGPAKVKPGEAVGLNPQPEPPKPPDKTKGTGVKGTKGKTKADTKPSAPKQ